MTWCDGLLQPSEYGWVAQRGDVTGLAAFRDIAQQPAHDLPGPGFGQVARQMIRLGLASLPIRLPTCSRRVSSRPGAGTKPDPRVT